MTLAIVRTRGLHGIVAPERTGFVCDMNYFLAAFGLAALAMFVPHVVSCLLITLTR
jgi:cation:H+ antiporter